MSTTGGSAYYGRGRHLRAGTSVVVAKRLESAEDVNANLVSEVVRQTVAGNDYEFEDRGVVALNRLLCA